jgi:hypothetical protein
MKLNKNNEIIDETKPFEQEEFIEEEFEESSDPTVNYQKPATKIAISDAKILLNSGKMGFVFIGIVVGFFVLAWALTFLKLSMLAYIVLTLLALPFILYYYIKIHEHDEDKLD